jgi:hypothetical protein
MARQMPAAKRPPELPGGPGHAAPYLALPCTPWREVDARFTLAFWPLALLDTGPRLGAGRSSLSARMVRETARSTSQ